MTFRMAVAAIVSTVLLAGLATSAPAGKDAATTTSAAPAEPQRVLHGLQGLTRVRIRWPEATTRAVRTEVAKRLRELLPQLDTGGSPDDWTLEFVFGTARVPDPSDIRSVAPRPGDPPRQTIDVPTCHVRLSAVVVKDGRAATAVAYEALPSQYWSQYQLLAGAGLGIAWEQDKTILGALDAFAQDWRAVNPPTATCTVASATRPAKLHAYWLTGGGLGEYVDLLISRQPIQQLSAAKLDAIAPLSEATAIVVTTYAKDSIWNVDRRPFKPVESAGKVAPDGRSISLNGKQYQYSPAAVDDVVALLEKPKGTIPIHRTHAPLDGAEDFAKELLERLKKQLRDEAPPAATSTAAAATRAAL